MEMGSRAPAFNLSLRLLFFFPTHEKIQLLRNSLEPILIHMCFDLLHLLSCAAALLSYLWL